MSAPKVFREVVICATQRCGSTLLCNDLANNGIGSPEEYFLSVARDFEAHKDRDIVADVIQRKPSENGIVAVKIMANYAAVVERYCAHRLGTLADTQALTNFAQRFAGAHWIFITRRDAVSQSVSRLMAQFTGVYHAILSKNATFVPGGSMVGSSQEYNAKVSISDSEIQAMMGQINRENGIWERFFAAHGIRPRRIVYEDTLADFSHVAAICRDLNLPDSPIIETRNLLKLGNKRSDEIVAGFKKRSEAAAGEGKTRKGSV